MSKYPLFSVLGLELEYMLVDKTTLDVQPLSDLILKKLAGQQVNEVVLGDISISNEFVLHVIELKNTDPQPPSYAIAESFQQTILKLQPLLSEHHIMLLPTGAHPWMNALTETKRWPHGDKSIYELYDTIFDCKGHGWANLQSMHINLPFDSDDHFCELHNIVRHLLPLLPALAASTPILDGKATGLLDTRLSFYGKNQIKIPSIAKDIIPESVTSEKQYYTDILKPMYQDISAFDPHGILQFEWLNSRGAIPKFERHSLEIRIVDSQECVGADIAIALAVHTILKNHHEKISGTTPLQCSTSELRTIYEDAIQEGLTTLVDSPSFLAYWHLSTEKKLTIREVWSILLERVGNDLDKTSQTALANILNYGNLSERILKACHGSTAKNKLLSIYRQLGECLLSNEQFNAL